MRKRLIVAAVAALICVIAGALTACTGREKLQFEGLPDSYEGMEVAKGKSAFELFGEAYRNFSAENDYRRVQYYDFSTTSGVTQSMQIKTTRKIKDEKLYSEEVVLAAGIMSLNEGKKTYFDGDSAYSLYFNDKKRVTGEGEDPFAVAEWDDFGAYDAERYGAIDVAKAEMKRLTTYRVDDPSCLADASDDTVYTDGEALYFTLTIDCSEAAMKGVQKPVAEAIAKKTASKPDDLTMKADTTLQAAVKIVDGVPKFLLLKIEEAYNGKLSFFKAECKTTYYNEFYYGEGAVTVEELKGALPQ